MKLKGSFILSLFILFTGTDLTLAQPDTLQKKLIPVAEGWARNSVNTVIFRQNSITTFSNTQFTAFYDEDSTMVLAKRQLGNKDWKIHKTQYKADVEDAHNAISIAVDGKGILHVSWGLHGQEMLYAQSQKPGSLELTEKQSMTGKNEQAVTYPQFYRLSNGDLLFTYRDGSSGDGDIMVNRFDLASGEWKSIAHPLIDGQGERNAYINTVAIDDRGGWHFSWTWRETWDVATNHDIMYAHSADEGQSWMRSNGEKYELPITIDNAEIAYDIPQKSELINQTAMTVDSEGNPVIASYWRSEDSDSPQYHIITKKSSGWVARQVTQRENSFSLSGGGTKRIPISRPQIIAGDNRDLYMIFRDFERGGGISIARSTNIDYKNWQISDIYSTSVGMWEPTYDRQAWKNRRELYLFVQNVGQGDGETLEDILPQQISLLKWIPESYINK